MKKYLLITICVLGFGSAFAQDFVKDGNYVTVGYGLDPWGHRGVGYAWGTYKKTAIGPIIATYERGITDILGIGRIGAGGSIGQAFYTEKYSSGNIEDVYRTSRLSIIGRGAYHFEFDVPKMDVYAGVGVGAHVYFDKDETYNVFTNSYNTVRDTRVGFGHYVFAGIRYFFTPAFGVYAEAGHGLSAINGGVVFGF